MQIAITGVSTDADAASFCKLYGLAHDVGVTGMEAAGDVDGGGKLDHGGVVAHLPGAKPLSEIAIEIDRCHFKPLPNSSFLSYPPVRPLAKPAMFSRRPR